MGFKTTGSLFALAVLICTSSCNRAAITEKESSRERPPDLENTLATSVSNAVARDFAMCQLRAAIWGDYDAIVNIEAAYMQDKKPRRFEMKLGQFSVTTPDRDVTTGMSRSNLVKISSKEDAFAKGVPFFIEDVSFVAPQSLSFRVWSNPTATVKTAAQRIQRVDRGDSGYTSTVEIVDTNHPISAKPESQTVTTRENRLDGWVLSLVTMSTQDRCLASNEIDLTALISK